MMQRSLPLLCLQLALAGSLVLGMNACASLGKGTARPSTEDGVGQVLTIGKSTRADVTKLMGDAKVNTFRSGYEVWVYNYKAELPAFVDFVPVVSTVATVVDMATRDRELAILFDRDGVVRKYRLREAESRAERLLMPH
jgi:hypothetical protein